MGVRMGVRSGLGGGHLPVRRSGAAAVRQGERGDLLQRAKDRPRDGFEGLVAANPARRCSLIVSGASEAGSDR